MVILHGVFGTSDNWFTVAKHLAENHGYKVYTVDQRNHGQSPHSDEWDYTAMVSDLNEFLDTHHLEQAIIVGHSMGGKVAMEFAGKHSEKVADLVVVDIGPKYYAPHHAKILEGLTSIDLSAIVSRSDADNKLIVYVKEPGVRQFLLKNLGRTKEGNFIWNNNLPVIKAKIEEVGKALPERLMYDGRCLFISGSNSKYITEEDLPGIAQRFPNYRLVTIEGAGHWVHAEKPAEFIETLVNYLG